VNAYLSWTHVGVGVSGTFICLGDVGYVKTSSGEVRFRRPPAPALRRRAGDDDHDHVHGAARRPEDVPSDQLVMRELAEAVLTFVVGSLLIVLGVGFFLAAS
jgi:hypothetical protein